MDIYGSFIFRFTIFSGSSEFLKFVSSSVADMLGLIYFLRHVFSREAK
ncbi:TPA: hypothetical protein JAZ42_11395 [Legionella pneumophila]|nr:hypothetical protein [Legionella pneumophila]